MSKVNYKNKIFKAALFIALGVVGFKSISVFKEIVVASNFGVSADLDAFIIAFILPQFAINLIGASFQAVVVPVFIELRVGSDGRRIQELFSNLNVIIIIGLSLITLLSMVFLYVISLFFSNNFHQLNIHLVFQLFCIMAPVFVITGISTIWGAVLNSYEQFFLAAFVPAMIPLTSIAFIFMFVHQLHIYALAISVVFGAIVELMIVAIPLKKKGLLLLPIWFGLTDDVKRILKRFRPMIAANSMTLCSTPIDQIMASMLSPGSVSALNYAIKIIAFPLTVASTGLGQATITYVSKLASKKDWYSIRRICRLFLFIIFIFSIIGAIALMSISHWLVAILYQRSAFSASNTLMVSHLLNIFSLQLPFYISVDFLSRILCALKKNHIFLKSAPLGVITNIILNFTFMHFMGLAGIALSTCFVFVILFFYLGYKVSEVLGDHTFEEQTT